MKYRFVRYRFVRYWFRFVSRPWLDTDIPSKHLFVSKTSSRHVYKTSSRHVLKTSSRHLQHKNFLSSKTSWGRLARCLQDVFKTYLQDASKTSWRRLGRQKIVTLKVSWRSLQYVLKTSKCLLGRHRARTGWWVKFTQYRWPNINPLVPGVH